MKTYVNIKPTIFTYVEEEITVFVKITNFTSKVVHSKVLHVNLKIYEEL